MIFNPSLHPEFGYLGAPPRLRRELRVAVFAGLFGIVIGAATVIAMSSGDRNGNSTTRAGAITTQAGPAPNVASVGNAPAPPGADLASSSQAKSSSIKAHPLTAPNGPEIARILLGRAAAPTVAAAPAEPAAFHLKSLAMGREAGHVDCPSGKAGNEAGANRISGDLFRLEVVANGGSLGFYCLAA